MQVRSQPSAMPACGGGPYLNASSRKPNLSWASSGVMPSRSKTRLCTSARWIRTLPPPISLPLHDDVVRVGQRLVGRLLEAVEPLLVGRGEGVVDRGPAAGPPHPVFSNIGASTTQQNAQVDSSIRPARLAISMRAAPSSSCASRRSLAAAKKMASPGLAPTASASPDRCSADRFLATGPLGSPVSRVEDHVGQAAGAAGLGPVLPAVELLAGLRRAAGHDHGAHVTAGGDRAGEDPELGAPQVVGQFDQLQRVTQIGLVGTVAVHRVGPGDPRDRAAGSHSRPARSRAGRRSPRRAR